VLEATVQRVEPSGFTHVSALGVEEQRVNVIVDPGDEPASEWDRIGDGYRVDVDVIVWEEADVLRVPAGAVYRRDLQWYVFTVEEGIARETPIEIGARSEEWAQILNGLEAGVPVIIYPPEDVEDGGKVESFAERDE
jgi:HlyD family secretion protein